MRVDTSLTTSTETAGQRHARKRARAAPPKQADSIARRGLTDTQIQVLRQRLLEERAKAVRAIRVKHRDMEDHRARGQLDELEWDIRMAERQTEFIVLIEDALRRLQESPLDFDISEASGARIPYERLELVPWTRRLAQEADPSSRS